jgi:glucose/arabinose dehydrogenase
MEPVMTLPIRLSLFAATLLAIAACASPSAAPGEPASVAAPAPVQAAPAPPTPATQPEPLAPEDVVMTCEAEKGLWAIGKIADEALVAKVMADTGSKRVRVIKPGMMVTMDFREDRVNLDVDADNRVMSVRCT